MKWYLVPLVPFQFAALIVVLLTVVPFAFMMEAYHNRRKMSMLRYSAENPTDNARANAARITLMEYHEAEANSWAKQRRL